MAKKRTTKKKVTKATKPAATSPEQTAASDPDAPLRSIIAELAPNCPTAMVDRWLRQARQSPNPEACVRGLASNYRDAMQDLQQAGEKAPPLPSRGIPPMPGELVDQGPVSVDGETVDVQATDRKLSPHDVLDVDSNYTTADLRDLFGISGLTIKAAVEAGQLQGFDDRGERMFRGRDVLSWIDLHGPDCEITPVAELMAVLTPDEAIEPTRHYNLYDIHEYFGIPPESIRSTPGMVNRRGLDGDELLAWVQEHNSPVSFTAPVAKAVLAKREAEREEREELQRRLNMPPSPVDKALDAIAERHQTRLANDEQKQRELNRRYTKLLRQLNNEPETVPGDEFADIVECLDVNRNQIERDRALVARYDRLTELQARDATAVQAELVEARATLKRREREVKDELATLKKRQNCLQTEVIAVQRAGSEILELSKLRGGLFTRDTERPMLLCDVES